LIDGCEPAAIASWPLLISGLKELLW